MVQNALVVQQPEAVHIIVKAVAAMRNMLAVVIQIQKNKDSKYVQKAVRKSGFFDSLYGIKFLDMYFGSCYNSEKERYRY